MGVLLCGDDIGLETFEGQSVTDDTFYLCFNSYHEGVVFRLPGDQVVSWQRVIDTSLESSFVENAELVKAGSEMIVPGRSMIVMKQVAGSDADAKKSSSSKPVRPTPAFSKIPKTDGPKPEA
jgi:pullulanase/glycogen debranching enzyme